ncbi:MAG: DUF4407 domain-containing protein [Roseiarcus sp.]|jgi:hypothetical protein
MDMSSVQLAPKAGPFAGLLLKLVGAPEETLRRCPKQDSGYALMLAALMVAAGGYQTAIFSMVGSVVFTPGQLRIETVAVALALAMFVVAIDSVLFMRSGWFIAGESQIRRGGLDISGGRATQARGALSLAIRLALSMSLAAITGVAFSALIFRADIVAQEKQLYLERNSHVLADASSLVDAEIKRATESVATENEQVAALAKQVSVVRKNVIDPGSGDPQIQQSQDELKQLLAEKAKADDEVQAAESFASHELGGIKGPGNSGIAGDGPRHKAAQEEVANAKRHAQEVASALDAARARLDALRKQLASANDATKERSDNQLPGFESALTAESAKLSDLKEQLADLTKGRDDAIRNAVENAPDYVGLDNGFLAQITALEHLAQQDSKIAWFILLIEVTSAGFELAAVLAKTLSYVPTTLAAVLASEAYMSDVRIVDGMTAELNGGSKQRNTAEAEVAPGHAPVNDNSVGLDPMFVPAPFGGPDDPPPPPKRRRGRPRKSPVVN